MKQITVLSAFSDNFIYLCRYGSGKAFVVDPGSGSVVWQYLRDQCLELTHILLTHHHFDHTGGVRKLKRKTGCDFFHSGEGDFEIGGLPVAVIAAPGHTKDSVCYLVKAFEAGTDVLFTGDTLFIGGCGRLMECSGEVMWHSLCKIKSLPDNTIIYTGHDYTEDNYRFALTIEPENADIQKALSQLKQAKSSGRQIAATTVGFEKKTNIFFRSSQSCVKAALGMDGCGDGEVFAEIRKRKDSFG